jgi:hypothetical protein
MMDAISRKYILATVEIPNDTSVEVLADRLGAVIDGIFFKEDEIGHFEEVPAFIAEDQKSNARFILFGVPDGEFSNAYTLELSAETDLPIPDFRKSTLKFLNGILTEKDANSRGYIDYSDEMANALTKNGITAAKSIL